MSDGRTATFSIGPAEIGAGSPVYVVAEAGVNHDGRLSVARELIHAAADAEADAIKFQVFKADRLVTKEAPTAGYQQRHTKSQSQYEMLSRLELSQEEFAELAIYAGHCGVEFLATPFSIPDVEFLVSLDVRAIKLASPDIVNGPLLDTVADTGLPVIASTGAANFNEVTAAVDRFRGRSTAGPLALLHCVSSYPASEWEANLAAIGTLARSFDCVAGFSDHTESLTIGGYAAAAGARIIEKHFTLDRGRPGPDHAFSLDPSMIATYIRNIRQAEQLLGSGKIDVTASQRDVRALSRGSVVAVRDIRTGESLSRSMLTIKRPGSGIPGIEIDALVGRSVQVDIPANEQVTWDAIGDAVVPQLQAEPVGV